MITLVDEDGISSVVRTISSMQPFIAEDWKIRDQGVYPKKYKKTDAQSLKSVSDQKSK